MEIKIDHLTKVYKGKTRALDDVTFSIQPGLFGLIGRNGAGKTTLMRIMATVLRPTAGSITFDGEDIFKKADSYRAKLGYLPQSTKLIPTMNIREFLDYMCVLKGISDKAARKAEVERCIEVVGLTGQEKKLLGKYSGGMLRRAGIAQAILGDPKLLIVDEPTTGLDPEEQLHFLNLLSKLALTTTIVFSTHIIQDIENRCENICIMENGRIAYLGSVHDLLQSMQGKLWSCDTDAAGEMRLRQEATVIGITYGGGKIKVRYMANAPVLPDSEPHAVTLEDSFISMIGGVQR